MHRALIPLLAVVLCAVCQAQSPARIDAGPLQLDLVVSETSQLYHIVDQVSQWSEFSHRQYYRYFRDSLGGFSDEDRKLLADHAAIRRAHGWGNGPDHVFYTSLDLERALQAGVAHGDLTQAEADTERAVLTHFRPRVEKLIADSTSVPEFVRLLQEKRQDLAEFARKMARFTGGAPPQAIPFYLIANPDTDSIGGGYNGGQITLEIPRQRNAYHTLLHELFHAFLELQKSKVEPVIQSVPGLGLDFSTLNEGLAYALSPGIIHDGANDQLARSVASDLAKGTPMTDSYARFHRYGLALRPILRDALDHDQTLETFLPRALDAWRVLIEFDAALPKPAK